MCYLGRRSNLPKSVSATTRPSPGSAASNQMRAWGRATLGNSPKHFVSRNSSIFVRVTFQPATIDAVAARWLVQGHKVISVTPVAASTWPAVQTMIECGKMIGLRHTGRRWQREALVGRSGVCRQRPGPWHRLQQPNSRMSSSSLVGLDAVTDLLRKSYGCFSDGWTDRLYFLVKKSDNLATV